MPLYDYACEECGEQAELLVRSNASPECPKCGGTKLSRLLPIVAAPSRGDAASRGKELPGGPCGASCACHPRG